MEQWLMPYRILMGLLQGPGAIYRPPALDLFLGVVVLCNLLTMNYVLRGRRR